MAVAKNGKSLGRVDGGWAGAADVLCPLKAGRLKKRLVARGLASSAVATHSAFIFFLGTVLDGVQHGGQPTETNTQ